MSTRPPTEDDLDQDELSNYEVVLEDLGWLSRARLQCPENHIRWEPMEGGFYCESCERHYTRMRDTKAGEMFDRSEILIQD